MFYHHMCSQHPNLPPSPSVVAGGAHGYRLLGVIARRTARNDDAIVHFQNALRLDCTMWSAYEQLYQLGMRGIRQSLVYCPLVASVTCVCLHRCA